jgi:hypothetical protein
MRGLWQSMNGEVPGIVFWPIAGAVIATGATMAFLHL